MFYIWGLIFVIFGSSEIARRAIIEVNGSVVEKQVSCSKPYNNRCVARYTIINEKDENVLYSAGPNDHSLSRKIAIGSTVEKERWNLEYFVNGNRVDDFPVVFYLAIGLIGVVILVIANFLHSHDKSSYQKFT